MTQMFGEALLLAPVVWFVSGVLLGLIPAVIAFRKGGSLLRWWIYGSLFLMAALPMALMLKPANAGKSNRKAHAIGTD